MEIPLINNKFTKDFDLNFLISFFFLTFVAFATLSK